MDNGNFFCKIFQSQILDIFSGKKDISFSGIKILGHKRKQSGFSTAVSSHDSSDISALYLKRYIPKDFVLSIRKR